MIQIFIRLWNYIRVRNAVRYADKLHRLNNKTYYVIQIGGKIRVISRIQANFLVNSGVLRKRMRNDYYLRMYSLYVTQ